MQIPQGLNYWISSGVGGHHITGFKRIQLNVSHIKLAIACFGVCILGMVVNQAMQIAFGSAEPWLDNYGPANEGHCVPVVAYDGDYVECVTWGRLKE
jgi:hypothetical protein